jgi:putative ABC transport system ATP-binding protein
VIALRDIERVYQVGESEVHALRDVGLRIPDGDYLSVMGPSGSGKSTLLNLLGCLDRPTSGVYELDGRDVARLGELELSRIRRHKIGFVFQVFNLVARLTAAGNVELPMIFAGLERAERARRVEEALEAVGLSRRAGHRPDQLSGGERQRVAIARAVIMKPSILLADEPTGNLDSAAGAEVLKLLEEMNARGITLVVVTHDPAIGDRARRRIRLKDGVVVEDSRAPSTPAEGRPR